MTNALLGPVLAQVGLTFVAWLILYARRLPAMAAAKPTKEQLQDKANLALLPEKARYAAENYNHLFEMPVLFYVLCLGAMIVGIADNLTVYLAWAYVGLRVVHTIIHTGSNNVMHRFTAFTLSGLVLVVMFGQIAFKYWSN